MPLSRRRCLALLALASAAPPQVLAATTARTLLDRLAAHGPHPSRTVDATWTDPARSREIPVRLRVPDGAGPWPVVLFSHGLGGTRDAGRVWAEHWASHGIAVVHLQHPGSDAAVWRGQAAPTERLRAAANGAQLIARVHDVQFALTVLAGAHSDVAPPFRADGTRLGLSGHSFGALTTQAVAGQRFPAGVRADPRPRAFVAFSPSARSAAAAGQFAEIARPFFSITGTEDGEVGPGLGVAPPLRRVPFLGMPPGDKYLLNLEGADHAFFGGIPTRMRGAPDGAARIVCALTTAFWHATLSDDTTARAALGAAAPYVGNAGEWLAK